MVSENLPRACSRFNGGPSSRSSRHASVVDRPSPSHSCVVHPQKLQQIRLHSLLLSPLRLGRGVSICVHKLRVQDYSGTKFNEEQKRSSTMGIRGRVRVELTRAAGDYQSTRQAKA
ncbi:hypothetical protein H6P81_016623 [Aristolochia fimbriata]|uniref:Uncharacterized protein n=1 Tax=Aristolochia fimbriata TaxID=158543 RepID=A0AAV7E8Y7_ARIFI|nr:hypothetical protein H6P81_016623 [Aristolochia fimbriata]